MGLDLAVLRSAIAVQIQGRVAREVNVYGGYLPDSPSPPAVLVAPDSSYLTFDDTLSRLELCTVHFRVRVVCPAGPSVDGQMVLDEFLSYGPTAQNSVIEALLADPTFGGAARSSTIESVQYEGRGVWGETAQTPVDVAAVVIEVNTRRNA